LKTANLIQPLIIPSGNDVFTAYRQLYLISTKTPVTVAPAGPMLRDIVLKRYALTISRRPHSRDTSGNARLPNPVWGVLSHSKVVDICWQCGGGGNKSLQGGERGWCPSDKGKW